MGTLEKYTKQGNPDRKCEHIQRGGESTSTHCRCVEGSHLSVQSIRSNGLSASRSCRLQVGWLALHVYTLLYWVLIQIFPVSAENLVSYSIPKGVQRGVEVDLSDQTYDGRDTGDRLVGGLGQLVDGQLGIDNFRSDRGHGKGFEWVGWRNDSSAGKPVEMIFEFDSVRNFSAMVLHTNNMYSKDVQVSGSRFGK